MTEYDSLLQRVLEPEVMDSAEEAQDYNRMDHKTVNDLFVKDLIAAGYAGGDTLDVGTGTALIPIELARTVGECRIMATDLAAHMLDLAKLNVGVAGLADKIQLSQVDAKQLPFSDAMFDTTLSNSIIHHIPDPLPCFREAVRVTKAGGLLFFRDLVRPFDEQQVQQLVELYAGNENRHSQQMFADSLHAALSLSEVRSLISQLGYPQESVQQTSDRHWTWVARR
ncbi:MAG TPA: class I SAM-dependent methyltransferase [Pirellulaceae bacterium]|nr:class I SAM-dependent methyltransferase [Pirellulaceae bacterium]HMO94013.1 class I SAM-dependent methyltransferase [Pirellulaceae bacterium]HMP70774.1 class I SAM-dependent methyltransferase [Pirellulaceae bacterium]